LEQLQQASRAQDFIDLSDEKVEESALLEALRQPAGNDPESLLAPDAPSSVQPSTTGEAVAQPLVELPPEPVMPGALGEADQIPVEEQLRGVVAEHMETDGGEKRKELEETPGTSSTAPAGPMTWQPNATEPRWQKKPKVAQTVNKPRVLTEKIKKKLLDKEVPFDQIPERDRELYQKAEEKEWAEWIRRGSVRVMSLAESNLVNRTVERARIIGLRFVYRDKNASIRTPQTPLPVMAKARLCAQAYDEPLAKAGLIKVDAPTVQRVGVMIFLQVMVNFEWIPHWRKGDVTAAFLQGKKRDVEKNGRLYLRQPRNRPLKGVPAGCLLEVIQSVYGLPDAPRAWWEELTGFLRSLGFCHSRVDMAFLVWYYDNGSIGIMIILHVDDIMITNDGTKVTEKLVEAIHKKYPFGEWVEVAKQGSVTYTGRTISVNGQEVNMSQEDFIKGRMTSLPVKKSKSRDKSELCTEIEKADFKSGLGDLHWVTSQTRVDHAVDTSRLQKRQQNPTYGDYLDLGRIVKEVKETASFGLRIRPIKNACVGAWTDSALYGAEGEVYDDDSDLEGFDKHKIYSQRGAFIALVSEDHLDDVDDIPISLVDWRTKASKRVHHSTFAAEAQAGTEAQGLAVYFRAYYCDVLFGHADWIDVASFGEEQCKIILFTDCKSLFDHLKKEGAVPDDKWTAVAVASLKCRVSAGPDRNASKSECRWVASRWQLADCLTKPGLADTLRQILTKGATRLHELSLQEIGRKKKKKANFVSLVIFDGSSIKFMLQEEKKNIIPTLSLSGYMGQAFNPSVAVFSQALPASPWAAAFAAQASPRKARQQTAGEISAYTTDSAGASGEHCSEMKPEDEPTGASQFDRAVGTINYVPDGGLPDGKATFRHTFVPYPVLQAFQRAPGWEIDLRACLDVLDEKLTMDHRERAGREKLLTRAAAFVTPGNNLAPLNILEPNLAEALLSADPRLAETKAKVLQEFPRAKANAGEVQVLLMKETLPWHHQWYVAGREARRLNKMECYFVIVPWIGLRVDSDYCWEEAVISFHGTPLSQALRIIAADGSLRQEQSREKNRSRSADNVRPDEAYCGPFSTACCYVLPQVWQNAHNRRYSCIAAVTAPHFRQQRSSKNKNIKLITNAKALCWIFREDNDEILKEKDRHMVDWKDPFKEDRQKRADKKWEEGPHPKSVAAKKKAAAMTSHHHVPVSSSPISSPRGSIAKEFLAPAGTSGEPDQGPQADRADGDGDGRPAVTQLYGKWVDPLGLWGPPTGPPPPPSEPPSDGDDDDPDLRENAKAMSKVKGQTEFRDIEQGRSMIYGGRRNFLTRGNKTIFVDENFLSDEGWPKETSVGATFSWLHWKQHKDALRATVDLENASEKKRIELRLKPIGTGIPTMDPAHKWDFDPQGGEVIVYVPPEMRAKRERRLTISNELATDLRLLRLGNLTNPARGGYRGWTVKQVFQQYSQQELLYAMRRGSDSLHVNVCATLQSRLRVTLTTLKKFQDELWKHPKMMLALEDLKEIQKSGDGEAAQEVLDVSAGRSAEHCTSALIRAGQVTQLLTEVHSQVRQMHGKWENMHSLDQLAEVTQEFEFRTKDVNRHLPEDIDNAIEHCKDQMEALRTKVRMIRSTTSDNFVDPLTLSNARSGRFTDREIRMRQAHRIGCALQNMEHQWDRAQLSFRLEREWMERYEQDSTGTLALTLDTGDVDRFAGFESQYTSPYKHITDDVPQEEPKQPKRPPLTRRQQRDLTEEELRKTAPWRRKQETVYTLDERLVDAPTEGSARQARLVRDKAKSDRRAHRQLGTGPVTPHFYLASGQEVPRPSTKPEPKEEDDGAEQFVYYQPLQLDTGPLHRLPKKGDPPPPPGLPAPKIGKGELDRDIGTARQPQAGPTKGVPSQAPRVRPVPSQQRDQTEVDIESDSDVACEAEERATKLRPDEVRLRAEAELYREAAGEERGAQLGSIQEDNPQDWDRCKDDPYRGDPVTDSEDESSERSRMGYHTREGREAIERAEEAGDLAVFFAEVNQPSQTPVARKPFPFRKLDRVMPGWRDDLPPDAPRGRPRTREVPRRGDGLPGSESPNLSDEFNDDHSLSDAESDQGLEEYLWELNKREAFSVELETRLRELAVGMGDEDKLRRKLAIVSEAKAAAEREFAEKIARAKEAQKRRGEELLQERRLKDKEILQRRKERDERAQESLQAWVSKEQEDPETEAEAKEPKGVVFRGKGPYSGSRPKGAPYVPGSFSGSQWFPGTSSSSASGSQQAPWTKSPAAWKEKPGVKMTPCKFHFSGRGCKFGSKCTFSHAEESWQ